MSGLRKDTSNMIQCKLSECTAKDSFITGTFGNQGTFKIAGKTLLGDILIKTDLGETRTYQPDAIVWRSKRLSEILHNPADKDIIGGQVKEDRSHTKAEASNRLVDIFAGEDNIDITAFF